MACTVTGDRLYLRVQGQARSWLFIYTGVVDGAKKRRELGLGGYPAVSLVNARKAAQAARDLIATGGDPVGVKVASRAAVAARFVVPTLGAVCEEWIACQGLSDLVAARYRAYVKNFLFEDSSEKSKTRNALSAIRFNRSSEKQKTQSRQPAHSIAGQNPKHVVLSAHRCGHGDRTSRPCSSPCGHTPTGPYVRSFLERVFDYAMVKGYVPRGLNVAALRGNLEHVLPRVKRSNKHHDAVPFADVPALYAKLLQTPAANALRFTILTASRQVEVREMRWCEVDLIAQQWRKTAERYKTRRAHVVPLSREALTLLGPQGAPDAFCFPSRLTAPFPSHETSSPTCSRARVTRMGSEPRLPSWAVEHRGFADDLAQRCLGHVVGTSVTRAYQRSDFLAPRRTCLDAWGAFVCSNTQQ